MRRAPRPRALANRVRGAQPERHGQVFECHGARIAFVRRQEGWLVASRGNVEGPAQPAVAVVFRFLTFLEERRANLCGGREIRNRQGCRQPGVKIGIREESRCKQRTGRRRIPGQNRHGCLADAGRRVLQRVHGRSIGFAASSVERSQSFQRPQCVKRTSADAECVDGLIAGERYQLRNDILLTALDDQALRVKTPEQLSADSASTRPAGSLRDSDRRFTGGAFL